MAYDAPSRPRTSASARFRRWTLTGRWVATGRPELDRELVADKRTPVRELGFGREVKDALVRRAERLVEMGLATDDGKTITFPLTTPAIARPPLWSGRRYSGSAPRDRRGWRKADRRTRRRAGGRRT